MELLPQPRYGGGEIKAKFKFRYSRWDGEGKKEKQGKKTPRNTNPPGGQALSEEQNRPKFHLKTGIREARGGFGWKRWR